VVKVARPRERGIFSQIKAENRRNIRDLARFSNADLAEKAHSERGASFATGCLDLKFSEVRTMTNQAFATRALHGGRPASTPTDPGAVVTPIFQTTTYAQPRLGEDPRFTYSRASNPTVSALEATLARLEGLPHALAFSSGMGAITTLLLTVLGAGDRVVVSRVVYGGTTRLLHEVLARFGVEAVFVDTADPVAVEAALSPNTRLILAESPGNPTLELADLAALGELAQRWGIPLAVDNTFLTAALQRPAEFGATVVIYSTTKFIEGHNAAVGGALLFADGDLARRAERVRKTAGTIQTPWNAWLTLQGVKTLHLRLQQHSANALELARWLEGRSEVERVAYPFLESFPQVALARRQQGAGGGLVSFELRGGLAAARAFIARLGDPGHGGLIHAAENLGAVETLITHPATMTHGDLAPARRRALGITEGLLRLSVGLEDPTDLKRALADALEAIPAAVEVTP
jgi:cystathionine beta-lyase/cystathionine gamma-synthase